MSTQLQYHEFGYGHFDTLLCSSNTAQNRCRSMCNFPTWFALKCAEFTSCLHRQAYPSLCGLQKFKDYEARHFCVVEMTNGLVVGVRNVWVQVTDYIITLSTNVLCFKSRNAGQHPRFNSAIECRWSLFVTLAMLKCPLNVSSSWRGDAMRRLTKVRVLVGCTKRRYYFQQFQVFPYSALVL